MKKQYVLMFVLLLLLLFSSCSSGIISTYIKSNQSMYYSCSNVVTIVLFSGYFLEFNPILIVTDTGKKYTWLEIKYSSSHWIFISPGKSLYITMDNKETQLSGDGSKGRRNVLSNGNIEERATYDCELEFFKEIGSSKTVSIKVIGNKSDIAGVLSKNNIKAFMTFYEMCLTK